MSRNDPDVLDREADELIEQFYREQGGTSEEDTPAVEEENEDQTPTETPSDTGGAVEGDPEEPAESGEQDEGAEETDEVAELREQLRVSDERYRNAQARMTKATQEAADLRRERDSLIEENTELKAKAKQSDAKPAGADSGDADLEQLLEDYPDVVGPLVSRVRKLENLFGEERETRTRTESERVQEEHFGKIESAHSDWEEIVSQDDWSGWVERQTPLRKRAAQEGTAEEVIELLDAYKQDMGLTPTQEEEVSEPPPEARPSNVERARKAAEPRTPRARKPDPNAGKRVFTKAEIEAMSIAQYNALEAEIDLAIMEGRVRS